MRKTILLILVVSLLCQKACSLDCYSYVWSPTNPNATDSPILPQDAQSETCSEGVMMCEKEYNFRVEIDGHGQRTYYAGFGWGCSNFEGMYSSMAPVKCGEDFELSTGTKYAAGVGGVFTYERSCTCCGDLCNGPAMDSTCNQAAQFTRKCHYGGTSSREPDSPSDPKLPPNTLELPCTEHQVCLKAASKIPPIFSTYEWACATLPGAGNKCGWSSYQNISEERVEKICTCCGDLCNGPVMDTVTIANADCSTGSTSANLDSSALNILVATQGSLIAILLVSLGVSM